MIETMDGVILAVRDAATAAKTYEAIFGTEIVRERHSDLLNADITSVACGTDLIRLAQPSGPGPVADYVDQWNEGLYGAVFTSKDTEALSKHLDSRGIGTKEEHGFLYLDPAKTFGLNTFVGPHDERTPVGAISFIYEVTHLVADWKAANSFWTDAFGLDGAKFSPIKSDQYGYEGMLTLFDPPRLLDRIEVVYPHDEQKAMGKFFLRRGEGPYMFFAECPDMPALGERLKAAGARFAGNPEHESASLFLHPSSTHGVLIGVSAKNVAWTWSGRPELAKARD
jgi:catechol 2,3-dioxygenase-like lactoylglutathione lyase family enzyme